MSCKICTLYRHNNEHGGLDDDRSEGMARRSFTSGG